MRRKVRTLQVRMRTDLNIAQIAGWLNQMLSEDGWHTTGVTVVQRY